MNEYKHVDIKELANELSLDKVKRMSKKYDCSNMIHIAITKPENPYRILVKRQQTNDVAPLSEDQNLASTTSDPTNKMMAYLLTFKQMANSGELIVTNKMEVPVNDQTSQ